MKSGDPSWKAEGGESATQVKSRAWEALMEIVAKNRGKMMGHGAPCQRPILPRGTIQS